MYIYFEIPLNAALYQSSHSLKPNVELTVNLKLKRNSARKKKMKCHP